MVILADDDLRVRARDIRLVVTDVDGVLTDSGVFYSESGEALKRFSIRDGMGVERLRKLADIDTVVDKASHLGMLEQRTGAVARQMAFIGDDDNDVGLMRAIVDRGGLSGAPANAFDSARDAAVYRTTAKGGHGAFREFAEWILRLRGP